MSKKLYFAGLVIVAGLVGLVSLLPNPVKDSVEGVLGGGNLPDRCEFFDQAASRSIKASVKTSSGYLYSYRIASNATQLRFFHLHDTASTTISASTIIYAVPLDTTTASATPQIIEEKFAVPMKFDSGIGFSIGSALGTWASQSAQEVRDSYFVTLCYN